MTIKLGFSPCPNDTYMMYGLLHDRVEGLEVAFEPIIADVEELNHMAVQGICDVTKLSFRTFYDVCDQYDLLDAGAALGRGNGPLLIAKEYHGEDALSSMTIAVPGLQTTATFLLHYAYPEVDNLIPMLFSDIEDAIRTGQVDAGVIIHETRFMYKANGFQLISDLGMKWEEGTNTAIPLGGFAAKNALSATLKRHISQAIKKSILYADQHYHEVLPFMKKHAQALDENIIRQHIDMFVNKWSKSLSGEGEEAITTLFKVINERRKQHISFNVV